MIRDMRGACSLAMVLLAGCSFQHGAVTSGDGGKDAADGRLPDSTPDSNDADTRTARAKTITVTGTVVGTHTNFPMWISLTDADLASRARADGTDIYFTDLAGAPLAFERQAWTKSTGALDAWVLVPSLATGSQIQVRYGDVTAASTPSSATVFADFSAVWHLEDSLATAAIVEARGTVPGTAVNLSTTDHVAGQLGGGINFTDGTDKITFTNPLSGSGPHTISLWVNQRATTNNDAMVVLGNGSNNQARWFHSRFDTATIAVGFYSNDWANPAHDIQGGGWVLLHWVFEGSNRMSRLYADGVLVAGPFQHNSGINTQGTGGIIGNAEAAFGSNMGLTATVDEVRITTTARSADWIAAEALNQKTPGSFYTVGTEFIP